MRLLMLLLNTVIIFFTLFLLSFSRGDDHDDSDDDCGYYGFDDDDDDYYGHDSCYDIYCSGLDCPIDKGPTNGCYWPSQLKGECSYYLSDTHVWDDYAGGFFWDVSFNFGNVGLGSDEFEYHVRCVRNVD